MSTPDEKKRKTSADDADDASESGIPDRRVLFVFNFYPMKLPTRETHYAILSSEPLELEKFDLICRHLTRVSVKLLRGVFPDREDIIDATNLWTAFIRFFKFGSVFDETQRAAGYKNAADFEASRRQLARLFMVPLGLVRGTDEFNSSETGTNFVASRIGAFKVVDATTVMNTDTFTSVIIVPPACSAAVESYILPRAE